MLVLVLVLVLVTMMNMPEKKQESLLKKLETENLASIYGDLSWSGTHCSLLPAKQWSQL